MKVKSPHERIHPNGFEFRTYDFADSSEERNNEEILQKWKTFMSSGLCFSGDNFRESCSFSNIVIKMEMGGDEVCRHFIDCMKSAHEKDRAFFVTI